jgi:hypothetical protein
VVANASLSWHSSKEACKTEDADEEQKNDVNDITFSSMAFSACA